MAGLDKATLAKLALPFDPNDVAWKPQAVRGNRALAVAYIDARTVAERLDQVVAGQWDFEWEEASNGCVKGKLTIRGTTRCDVGEQGDGPQGKTLKAAVSDALKRSAVLFGIARYLYRLPAQWVDYDAQHKRLARTPELPDWAKPGAEETKRRIPSNLLPGATQIVGPEHESVATDAEPPEPAKPHWIKNELVRTRFWVWTRNMALTDTEVHEALGVEHVADYAGSMLEAKEQIIAYVNAKAEEAADADTE